MKAVNDLHYKSEVNTWLLLMTQEKYIKFIGIYKVIISINGIYGIRYIYF